jgi:hypothetical protein
MQNEVFQHPLKPGEFIGRIQVAEAPAPSEMQNEVFSAACEASHNGVTGPMR